MKENKIIRQEEDFKALQHAYQHHLLQSILLLPALLSSSESEEAADKGMRQAFAVLSTGKKRLLHPLLGKEDEKKWLSMCRYYYHIAVAEKLTSVEIENELATSLLQIDNTCRDFLSWYYINRFSMEQMVAMAGQPFAVIKKETWHCRKKLQEQLAGASAITPGTLISEDRFYLLADYFENHLQEEETSAAAQLNRGDDNDQKNDALELLLRYRVAGSDVITHWREAMKSKYLSAKEFSELVKQGIQQPSQNKTTP